MQKELIKNSLIMLSVAETLGLENLPMTEEQSIEVQNKMDSLAYMGMKIGKDKQVELFQEIFTDAMKEFLCYKLN